ncbi:DciA family protein [Cumulibacter soli]|uniref:DciA family protein n=1 Tax=Cumulibacter soli TaxID=2546344 RepID=UPI0014194E0D|nr:DciA family protein [Cumulibacter soli]
MADDEQMRDPAAAAFANLADLAGSTVDPSWLRRTTQKSHQTDQPRRRRRWSGAGPSVRDPRPVGTIFGELARTQGWAGDLQRGRVLSQWSSIVGDQLASKAQATSLVDGELEVRTESTAWATQLRSMNRVLLTRIEELVGPGVVRRIVIKGPAAPSWKHGRRSVRGRGPRDTYG